MARVNENYLKLKAGYLFPEIGRRVRAFAAANPSAKVIRLGIGDVTRPLPPAVLSAFHDAVDELGDEKTFMGYGPEQGYDFLIDTLIEKAYTPLGVHLKRSEIFISDGSKCDTANILDIFALDNKVAIGDPVYPVYNDTNVMIGRTGPADERGYYQGIVYLPCTEANGFFPDVPKEKVDIIYLCFPNNPTGTVATKAQLKGWVDYALANDAVIFFDAAYEAFITEPGYPALDLRDRRGEEVRHRVPLLLQDRRLHRRALRADGRAGGGDGERRRRASGWRSTSCGSAGRPPSSTAPPTRCRGPRRRSTPTRGGGRRRRSSTTTWRTPGSSGRGLRARGSPSTAASTPPTSG